MQAGARRARTARIAVIAGACATTLVAAAPAAALPPDVAERTPVALAGTAAASEASISAAKLEAKLGRVLGGGGSGTAAWVYDTGSKRELFGLRHNRRRILASNTKLFTTATALDRLGARDRLQTRVWAAGPDPGEPDDPQEAGLRRVSCVETCTWSATAIRRSPAARSRSATTSR